MKNEKNNKDKRWDPFGSPNIDELMDNILNRFIYFDSNIDFNSLPRILRQGNDSIKIVDASKFSLPKELLEVGNQYEESISEIYENEKESYAEVTLEFPNVLKEKIIITYFDKGAIITGEAEKERIFQKSFHLKFSPDRNKTKIHGKNGVFQIIFRK